MPNSTYAKLEFNTIKTMLAEHALCENAKQKCLSLAPDLTEAGCRRAMDETTRARRILDAGGTPPLTAMGDIEEILTLCRAGAMLVPDQILRIGQFLVACQRMQGYLKRAQSADEAIASYAASFSLLPELSEEINQCIRAGMVDSRASAALASIRRKQEQLAAQIGQRLAGLAQSHKQWLSDSAPVQRNGRYVLAVKREYKSKISGAVVDMSGTGGTVFIEPSSIAKLGSQVATLQIEEENEVRRVLYTLSSLIDDFAAPLRTNMQAMETLDFLFAKAKLSAALHAGPVQLTVERRLHLIAARHPLLPREAAVPLQLSMNGETHGIIITGPNTGGKTVALKTVGLLSLMAQCGLHVTAAPESTLCLFSGYLCDIGDGQSISQNLSTFSSHITTVIQILQQAGSESLVLLDELGSGTDPAEGMGIAVAVLESLRQTGCMLVATTHYPEVKQYARQARGFTNARMAFNRETMQPTYQLQVGQAGESCALYIAHRLGLPAPILQMAEKAAYSGGGAGHAEQAPPPLQNPTQPQAASRPGPSLLQATPKPRQQSGHAASFGYGDSVSISPGGEKGIVYQTANAEGQIGVQVKGAKRLVPHKRLSITARAETLYPPDYDFSIVFDSKQNRRARKQMEKGHNIKGNTIHYDVDV